MSLGLSKYDADVPRVLKFLAGAERDGTVGSYMRGGILNRCTISKELNIVVHALHIPPLNPILDAFEEKLKGLGFESRWDTHLDKIRNFLERAHAAHQLPLSWIKGKAQICRATICEKFAIPSPEIYTHIGLVKLMREYDGKIDLRLYRRIYKYEHLTERLRAIVFGANVPVYNGRINKRQVARMLRVNPNVFQITPGLPEILQEAEEQFEAVYHAEIRVTELATKKEVVGKLDPYVESHQRRYQFREFVNSLGLVFTLLTANSFRLLAATCAISTAKMHYRALTDFFRCVVDNDDTFCSEANANRVTADTLENAAYGWKEALTAR
jgi:hypothetical protein